MLLQSIARIISGVISRHDYLQKQTKLQLQLNQAQKMESVGRLAGGVAHDFNNMLNVILGHTEMLLEDMNERNPLLENVLEIQKAARHSADLTGQLLAFARKQAIAPKVVDLNQVIRSMLSMLKRLIGENIALKFYEGKNLHKTKIDPSQLDQILANLVVNARDAIQGNGIISIETLNLSPDASYLSKRSEFVPGDYVLLAISDNGSGMDEKTVSCIFEPFFTTKAIGKGTGLGLATVYGIVKQNNGFVYVYSEKDIGSCFKIFLPRHFEAEAVMVEKNSCDSAPTGNECVLLVEDEPIILKMTKKILERLGYQVVSTQSPLEAIRLADVHRNEIRLLISDVVMPQANGKELAKALVENIPNLKTLFISGYTADVIATHGILDEGLNFLQKPFTRNELAQKVRDILDKQT
jgi:nitrogen-specific signal transduction histidine kinase/CheY-like chemotaxis protein